jgi:hypothetical protein
MATIREHIEKMLEGIRETDATSENGWWGTEKGARFGNEKINELLAFVGEICPLDSKTPPG